MTVNAVPSVGEKPGGLLLAAVTDPALAPVAPAPATPAAPAAAKAATAGAVGGFSGLGLILMTTALFYRCVFFPDFFIDEFPAVVRNGLVTGELPWGALWTHDFWGAHLWEVEKATHKSFRPVTTAIYRLLGLMAGTYEPFYFRLFGCVVHSVCTGVVFFFARRVLNTGVLAASVAALWFSLHPVHVENIVYIVGSADSLATVFGMLGVFGFCRGPAGWGSGDHAVIRTDGDSNLRATTRGGRSLGTYGLLLLASLSKESGFTYLAVLFYVALARREYFSSLRVLGVTVAFTVARFLYVGGSPINFAYADVPIIYEKNAWVRFLSYIHYHYRYGVLLLAPLYQSWDYSYDAVPLVRSLLDLRNLGGLSFYTSLFGLAFFCLYSRRASLALALTVAPFVPVSSLFMAVGTVVGERLLYPVTAGFALLIALGIQRLGDRSVGGTGRGWQLWLGLAFLAAYLSGFGTLAHSRLTAWSSKSLLYKADAENFPRSCKTVHQYGAQLLAEGRDSEASMWLKRSLEIFDDNAVTDYLLAQIAIKEGDFPGARQIHDKIANGHGIGFTDFSRFMFLIDYGWLFIKLNMDWGHGAIQEGLEIFPHVAYAWNALAVREYRAGNFQAAADLIVKALGVDGGKWEAWMNGACIAWKLGDAETAQAWLKNAQATGAEISTVQALVDRLNANLHCNDMHVFWQRLR